MRWMVRLYPPAWRERYGEEFAHVLEKQRSSLGLVIDVLGGALDARLHPQPWMSTKNNRNGGDTMTNEMLERCAAGGPKLSRRGQMMATGTLVAVSLVMAVLYIVLRKIYHGTPAVEAVGYASFPAIMLVYTQAAYLQRRPWLTRLVFVFSGCAGMYLFMFGACVIADKL